VQQRSTLEQTVGVTAPRLVIAQAKQVLDLERRDRATANCDLGPRASVYTGGSPR
jgi:hypothetical protein